MASIRGIENDVDYVSVWMGRFVATLFVPPSNSSKRHCFHWIDFLPATIQIVENYLLIIKLYSTYYYYIEFHKRIFTNSIHETSYKKSEEFFSFHPCVLSIINSSYFLSSLEPMDCITGSLSLPSLRILMDHNIIVFLKGSVASSLSINL